MTILRHTFTKDNYIQIPNLKTFCKERKLKISHFNKVDFINEVEKYGKKGIRQKKDVIEWAVKTIKEGSKECCYRKIYRISEEHKNFDKLDKLIKSNYPNCPNKNVLEYGNTDEIEMINYRIILNEKQQVKLVSFVFSGLVFEGERLLAGEKIIYPVFIDFYIEKGFIVTKQKAKSTIYEITESEQLSNETHIDTKKYAVDLMNHLMKIFGMLWDKEGSAIKNKVYKMQYKLYEKYSFTPKDVKDIMNGVKKDSEEFVKKMFLELELSTNNLENAINDLEIFAEKYVSINGNNENVFKNDREAYLVKVVSDDEQEMTRVDTSSSLSKPLQCTEAFFDSKKAIIKSKQCEKLQLCFKRKEKKYFGDDGICVQFEAKNNYGIVKIAQYAEAEDTENVLQTVFENY